MIQRRNAELEPLPLVALFVTFVSDTVIEQMPELVIEHTHTRAREKTS